MKKTMILAAMASLAMASCSKEETVSTNTGRGIDFRVEMETRAEETTAANLNSFWVTAFNNSTVYFQDEEFTKDGGFYTSATDYYWPGDDSDVEFVAYAPAKSALGGTLTMTNSTRQLNTFKPKDDIASQVDFITAKATGNRTQNETSGVKLQFKHALAQIGIQAKNDSDLTYNIAGVKIGMVASTGTYNFKTDQWTLTTTGVNTHNYEIEYTDSPIELGSMATPLMGEGGNAMLLPQQLTEWDSENDADNTERGAYLSVLINVTNASGDVLIPNGGDTTDYIWAAVPIGTKWESGYKYIYTLDFTNGPGIGDPEGPTPGESLLGGVIKFTVTVDKWVDAGEDITM